jgi:solute carrier family 13 (sodium-dependent dicarboxylate transporter), member 2/3/5
MGETRPDEGAALSDQVDRSREMEPEEILSEGEKQFETWRRTVGWFLGPIVALIIYNLSLPSLSPQAHLLATILAWVVIYWITEPIPIPVTAMLGPALCVVVGVGVPKDVFAPFANPIIFLFIGSFFIARAMQVHRLDQRMALWILSLPFVGESPYRILFVFGAITGFLSMWLSNTASTAMMFPIALGILGALKGLPSGRMRMYSTGLMLMIAYSASVGGIGTIIGTPPNLIGVGLIEQQLGVKISFVKWMALGVPLFFVMYLVLYFLLVGLHRPDVKKIAGIGSFIRSRRKELGVWTAGQINTAIAFSVAVFLWTFPGLLALQFGTDSEVYRWYKLHLPEGVVALLAASLLFLMPLNLRRGELTLPWRDAATIDWGTILLFGGGLALGGLMFKTGLSEAIGEGFVEFFKVDTLWGITALAIIVGIITSEMTSNTASATMVIPVMIAMAQSIGVSAIPPALGACLGASYGFMLPVSTPPNAIVYGSGLVPITRMVRAGVIFDVIGFLMILGALRVLCPLLGLQ